MNLHVPTPNAVARPKQTTEVDRLIGLRICALRKAKGLSQTALGTAVGVTFQQVQKYEKGQNRVGAGRLREIARLLEVPVTIFFGEASAPSQDDGQGEILKLLQKPGAIELLRHYGAIEDRERQRAILALVCGTDTERAAP